MPNKTPFRRSSPGLRLPRWLPLSTIMVAVVALLPRLHRSCLAVIPPANPPWPPTYSVRGSLTTMAWNTSGLVTDPPDFGSRFGIVSYDWSNAKAIWASAKPMTCEEMLVEQAVATKGGETTAGGTAVNGSNRVFVYRNLVKALPWFKTVREKMDDPAYDGFFLKFADDGGRGGDQRYHVPDCAPENASHCSPLYHDQEQTPQVPTASHPNPDGSCTGGRCDCGARNPCGEYLFDHRNGTMLRDFLVNELILGDTAVGHPAIDGLFIDDYWCSDLICDRTNNATAGCPCDDPVQGPTEIDSYSQVDMGLTDQDIADITVGWNDTMSAVQEAMLRNGAYTWSLMAGQENANAWPFLLRPGWEGCEVPLRRACGSDFDPTGDTDPDDWQRHPKLFGFTPANGTTSLAQLEQDLAFFLLVRGPYTYAGWGEWGMKWPFQVPIPDEFDVDYGEPVGRCYEVGSNGASASGLFRRTWSRAVVELDCNAFSATIVPTVEALLEVEAEAEAGVLR